MLPPHSFIFFLILNVFYTSQIVIPVNESFLGVGIGNITCGTELHQWHISSQPEMPAVSQLHDGRLSCSSPFDFFSYSGSLHFTVNVNRSSAVLVNNDYWNVPPPSLRSKNTVPFVQSSSRESNSKRKLQKRSDRLQDKDSEGNSSANEVPKENPIKLKVCNMRVELLDLHVYPPDPFLSLLSVAIMDFLNPHFEQGICSYLLPFLEDYFVGEDALLPLLPPPEKNTHAVPLRHSSLFRSLVHLLHALPSPVPGATLRASFIGDTSLRISCVFEKGLEVTYHSGDEKNWTVFHILVSAVMKHIPSFLSRFFSGEDVPPMESWSSPFSSSSFTSNFSVFLPSMSFLWAPDTLLNLVFHTSLPPHSRVSMDINLKDLYWDEDTYTCRLAQDAGIAISNWRIEGAGEFGGTFTNNLLPILTKQINLQLNRILHALPSFASSPTSSPDEGNNEAPSEEESRYVLIPVKKPLVQQIPPITVLIGYTILSCVVCFVVVLRGLWLQRRNVFLSSSTLEPISSLRVVTEDLILCLGVCTCLGCFVWSNCTTAATVVLGEDLVVYRFSLRSTVTDLWAAGLNPLAFAVALFSGVYPYVKLMGVIYFTVWKCAPKASTLHALDCLGKLSLLDTFVMLIMVTGLTVHDVVDVRVFPPFYVFLAGTLGSIAVGSFATQCWRRNTTLHDTPSRRVCGGENPEIAPEEEANEERCTDPCCSALSLTSEETPNSSEVHKEERDDRLSREESFSASPVRHTIIFPCVRACHWKRGLLMCIVSFPAWCCPLVSYRVGGVGPLLTSGLKTFNLYQLSASVDPVCLMVTLFTVWIAPCLYVLAPGKLSWLASWCAADALVLACIAGLLQLNQFVEFIIGEDLIGVYTAHATLHLSLFPLLLAAVYVWWLVAKDLFHLKGVPNPWNRLQERIAAYGERSVDVEETTDLLS